MDTILQYLVAYQNLSTKQKLWINVAIMCVATILLTALFGGWAGIRGLIIISGFIGGVGGFVAWLMYIGALVEKL